MVFHLPQRSRYESVYWRWFLWWPCYEIFLATGINHRPSRVYIIYLPCWQYHACFWYLFLRLCWWFTTVCRVWSQICMKVIVNVCSPDCLLVLMSSMSGWFKIRFVFEIKTRLCLCSHINTICKSVNFHIRNIWRIRRFITTEACHHIVRGLVLSRLDYANSLLFGACEADLTRLQRLRNKAARLVMSCRRGQSSTDLLRELHWLLVKQRIIYKLMLYTKL